MSEHLQQPPYPEREHLDAPQDPADYIRAEIRRDIEGNKIGGQELRHQIRTEFAAMYGGSNLVQSFGEYARNLAHARISISGSNDQYLSPDATVDEFNLGSLVATHSCIQMFDHDQRQSLLGQFYTDQLQTRYDDNPIKRRAKYMSATLETSQVIPQMFASQPAKLQLAVMEIADAMYSDYPGHESVALEDDFIYGYVYAANGIVELYKNMEEYGFVFKKATPEIR